MPGSFSRWLWIASLGLVAADLLLTTQALPERMASHFNAAGTANGFMPRAGYCRVMLAAALGPSLVLVGLMSLLYRRAGGSIRIPTRDYWLAPQRREATVAFLIAHAQWFGVLMALFMAYVHHLVLRANAQQPAQLSSGAMKAGLTVFLAGMVMWVLVLPLRFARRG